mmetsp:Transcript_2446/g.4745  ORF Transcript_2446/g.4745 Transcript_2446/m.4745 type:complete len:435 (+) Transcript_2446:176-1480(+)
MEGRALALWPQVAQATNTRDWPRVYPLLDALHQVMASADDLTPSTREALDTGIPSILDHLPASRSIFDAAAPDERGKPRETCTAASTPATVPVVGLMITKEDHAILEEWLEANLRFLDGLVLLDGSEGGASRGIFDRFRDASTRRLHLHYMHEATTPALVQDPTKTDQTLRRVVHRRIRSVFGSGVWIMLCHPDEFFYHDPRTVAAAAQAEGADHVFWWALQVLPHPSERAAYEGGRGALVQHRFRHFHHSFEGAGRPFLEGRLFRDARGVQYGRAHFQTLPAKGLSSPWRRLGSEWLSTWHGTAEAATIRGPAYLHYKVVEPDPSHYVERRYPSQQHHGSTFSFWARRHHFDGGGAAPTGFSTDVSSIDGFYVSRFENYAACTRFTGCLRAQPWSLPEEYRANRTWPLGEGEGACEDEELNPVAPALRGHNMT